MSTTVSAAMVLTSLVGLVGTANAVTDPDPEFHLTPHDLDFILEQITIAENHAAGGQLLCANRFDLSGTCVPDADLPWGLRTVDGSYNNLYEDQDHFGAGGVLFPRLAPSAQRPAGSIPTGAPGWMGADGLAGTADDNPATTYVLDTDAEGADVPSAPNSWVYDPEPRIISNLIADQTTDNPAAVAAAQRVEGSIINDPVPADPGQLQFTRSEETAAALAYDEGWISLSHPARSGGSMLYTGTPNAGVTATFTGSTVRWIGSRGPSRGVAEVYLDGVLQGEVDLYQPSWAYQQTLFEAADLGAGTHTLRIVNTGRKAAASAEARTEVDAIDIGTVVGATPAQAGEIFIPNVAPDEGLSAPFNSWFTLFGQFFDHGLDLVSKGGNGTVVVPLQPDDPLYVPGARTNFLTVTRATQSVGPDGKVQHTNRTTPFVDQNQTYTSHASHQFFLREYEVDPALGLIPTGKLLNGDDFDGDGVRDGLATWADIKEQAEDVLGIALDDMDVHDVPLVATDPYGRFIPGPNGYPQIITLIDPAGADVPENRQLVEADPAAPVDGSLALESGHAFLDDIAHSAAPNATGTHDADLLAAHYITGDGRGNENIGLTAVHHVFHAEHNRLVDHVRDVLTESGRLTQWSDTSGPWDLNERLFQAARFATEMQYQHLAFEEFGRFVQPNIDNQPVNETAYHPDINPAISAEFAHVVYRFGHSMLTDTVDREGWGTDDLALFDAFLAPHKFASDAAGNPIHPDRGAGAVIQGMVNQTGNAIDEFVVPVLRNQLLGLPLDLATINMVRARETGMPTLQEARQAFWEETADGALKPYENWDDFRLALRHRESIVNFVAAYGIHPTLDAATTVAAKRAAAEVLVADPAFMRLPAAESGLDDVDFWMGGLAESGMVFGGLLGNTFNYVFETQLEALQNADRFYYLTRTQGLNLLAQLENNSFSELIMRNTESDILPANMFASPDLTIDLDNLPDPRPEGLLELGPNDWRYDGPEHVVLHGTELGERIRGGLGDDSVWGHGGDDQLEGDVGNDTIQGGSGNDRITDLFGDDTIHGGPGNDVVNAGSGFDLMFGNSGNDYLYHGNEPTTSFAGADVDFVRGGNANDILTGNEDDDWLEGANGHDLVQGDNALTFQNDPVGGADVLWGGSGNDDHDAEGGDDIMLNNAIDRHAGMLGFDWVTHKHDPFPGDSDLDVSIFQAPDVTLMRARFMNVEGLSGWNKNDVLRGRDDAGDQFFEAASGHELTLGTLDRIAGLRTLLGGTETPGTVPLYAAPFMVTDRANDIIIGGAGSDILEGRAGDDFLDGDAWLDVYLVGPGGERQESMQGFQTRLFNGTLTPDQISIVREIVTAPDQGAVIDTAVYADVRANHAITDMGGGLWRVAHIEEDAGGLSSGVDILRNVERLVFSDEVIELVDLENGAAFGTIGFSTMQPVEDQEITALVQFDDPQGVVADSITWTWQWQDDEGEYTTSASGSGATFVPGDTEAGWPLRVVATFLDGQGTLETITSQTTLPVQNVNDPATGLAVSDTEPVVGDVVMAVGLTDGDGLTNDDGDPTVTIGYQWQTVRDGVVANIADATNASLTVTEAMVGAQLQVRARFTDNLGGDEDLTSAPTAAVTPPAVPGAELVSEATVALSAVAEGEPATATVVLRNPGTAPLSVGFVYVDADAVPLVITDDSCVARDGGPTGVAPGGECTITVEFAPTTTGTWTVPVVIEHDAGDPLVATFELTATAPAVVDPGTDPEPAVAPALVTMTPQRMAASMEVTAGAAQCVQIAGVDGVPAGATGVTVNVTTVSPTGPGYVVVYPDTSGDGSTAPPNASSVNFEAGKDVANAGFVALPENGRLCYTTAGASSVGVLIDVTGYTLPGSGIEMRSPERVLDTRPGSKVGDIAGPVTPGRTYTVPVRGVAGVPADAESVLLNVTVTGVDAPGNLRVFPGGSEVPGTSTVNYAPGMDKANATMVALSGEGTVSFWSDSSDEVHVVLDVVGWTTPGSSYRGLAPERLVDSRDGTGIAEGRLQGRQPYTVQVGGLHGVPAGASAVVVNVTAIGPTAEGNLRVYPDADGSGSSTPPNASTVNYIPGRDIANLAIVDLPENGRITMWSDTAGTVDLAVDVVGYITSAATAAEGALPVGRAAVR
nr:peroxidase family protein [uncultured Actinotalea sp.]